MKLAILVQLITIFSIYGQDKSFEQVALDYYTQNIHHKEYSKSEKYLLNNSIQSRKSSFWYRVCFEDYKKVEKAEILAVNPQPQNLRLESNVFAFLKSRRRTKKSVIFVNQADLSPTKTIFVEIAVLNQRTGKHYYIELTPQKEPLRWCKTEVIF